MAAAAREGGWPQPYPSALGPSTATLALGPTLTALCIARQVPRYLGYLRLLFEAP